MQITHKRNFLSGKRFQIEVLFQEFRCRSSFVTSFLKFKERSARVCFILETRDMTEVSQLKNLN